MGLLSEVYESTSIWIIRGRVLPGDLLGAGREFSGSGRPMQLIFLAKKVWEWLRVFPTRVVKLVKSFQKWINFSVTVNKRGRPTTPDSFLLDSRNAWRSFFEEYWPEIGWPLLNIRNRRTSTIEDVRSAFAALKDRPQSNISACFWSGSPQPTKGTEFHRNRIRVSKLIVQIQKMDLRLSELRASRREARVAVQQASAEAQEMIQAEADRRKVFLLDFEEDLARAENDYRDLDKRIRDQGAYWYCSELLDFLCGRRYALDPLNLANALAGLPDMRWRQSHKRCSAMREESFVHFPYRVFLAIARIWGRRVEEFRQAPSEFFRTELIKLPKEHREAQECLCQNWRDLRLAIEECWRPNASGPPVSFAITSAFVRNTMRQKSDLERVLADQERIPI
jgi:hypothetical protein